MPRQRVGCLVFSPDGKALLACGDLEPFVYEWDVATGDLRHQIELRDDITPAGLAITPDGQTIAVSDSGNQRGKNFSGGVLLLERGTGKLVRELPTPGVQAIDVVFSPDGRWLAAAGGVGVHVWDWRIGEEVAAGSAGHRGGIDQIATAPGGLIATASDDHTVRIWDAATGIERRRLLHRNWVRAIAVSPDGRFLASSSLDNSVRLWDISSGKEVYKLPGHGLHGGRRTVGFTPDGRRFLSYGDDLYLRIWDVRTGKVLTENAVRPPGVAEAGDVDPAGRERMTMLGPAAFTPDGQHLVATLGGSFHIIETATGRVEKSVEHPGGHVMSLAVAPDGRTFATSGWGRPIQRNLPDGRVQSTTPNHHPVCLFERGDRQAGSRAGDADGRRRAGGVLGRRQAPGDRLRPGPRRGAPDGPGDVGDRRRADGFRLQAARDDLLRGREIAHHRPERRDGPGLGPGAGARPEGAEGGAMNRMIAVPGCAARPWALFCNAVGVNRRGVLIVVILASVVSVGTAEEPPPSAPTWSRSRRTAGGWPSPRGSRNRKSP